MIDIIAVKRDNPCPLKNIFSDAGQKKPMMTTN